MNLETVAAVILNLTKHIHTIIMFGFALFLEIR